MASSLLYCLTMGNRLPRSRILDYFMPGLLMGGLLTLYMLTIAPGLTWSNRGADGGDLITAAATGGIPHPSGYPTYLLVAGLFQRLPFGTLAYRTNLLSLFAALGTCLIVYQLLNRILPEKNRMAGIVAGYALGLSPLFWSQALITEVYTLHAFFVAMLLLVTCSPLDQKRSNMVLGLLFGVSLGNHLTTLILLPLLLIPHKNNLPLIHWDTLIKRVGWACIGSLVYLALPWRAALMSPVNWGNPVTLENFFWLVTGRLYQDELFNFGSSLWFSLRVQSTAALMLDQFGLIGLILGIMGLVFSFRATVFDFQIIWVMLAFLFFALVYTARDSQVHLISVLLVFSLFVGIGVDLTMRRIAVFFPALRIVPALFVLVALFVSAFVHLPAVDASRDSRAERFGLMVMEQSPEKAILFIEGDKAVFSLWYFHYALGQRPDLVLIASDLLGFEWYRETLRNYYPSFEMLDYYPLPEELIYANPGRIPCWVKAEGTVQMLCDAISFSP